MYVIAYAVMSDHLHLLLFIEKPATLKAWEEAGYFLGYDFARFKEGGLYRVSEHIVFTQAEVDKIQRLSELPVLDRYEMTREDLVERLRSVMRPRAFELLMAQWGKMRPEEMEGEYARHLTRMFDLSAFMKILKQDISQYYNVRHKHTGALWEGRFKDCIFERSVEAMSSVATYIDLNAWRAKMCEDPCAYKWCGWGAALCGDERRRKAYNFIYDSGSDAEKEEAVFTSGAIVGSDAFIQQIVQREEEAFPTGHKTPSVDFGVGGVVLFQVNTLLTLHQHFATLYTIALGRVMYGRLSLFALTGWAMGQVADILDKNGVFSNFGR